MKIIVKSILVLLIFASAGCEKENGVETLSESNKLIGHWVNPVSDDSKLTLTRASSLKDNEYGISFLEKNNCIERSSGWCGTPPLVYTDYQGTWIKNDADLIISVDSEVGDAKWRIITLDDKNLTIQRVL